MANDGYVYDPDERYLLTRLQQRPTYVAVSHRKEALIRLKVRGLCTIQEGKDDLAGVLIGLVTPSGRLVDPLARKPIPGPWDPTTPPPRIA